MKRITLPFAYIFSTVFLLAVLPGRAATFTWTNAVGGNWGDGLNWNPNGTPGASDTAILPDVGNSYVVTLDVTASVSNLVVGATSGINTQTFNTAAQTLTLNGVVQVHPQGTFNFNGGTLEGTNVLEGTMTFSSGTYLEGTMTVSNNSVLNIAAGGGNVFFIAATLTNHGTVNWTNTALYTGAGTLIYNYGLWNAQGDDNFAGNYDGNPGTVFENIGTFRKTGATGTTTLDSAVTLDNTGTVDVESGTLTLNGGGTSSGTGIFNSAGGAAIDFDGGYNFFSVSSFSGAGGLVLNGGSFTVNGLITNANVQLESGTLTGTNVLEGTLTMSGGTLYGVMTVSNSGVLDIAAGGGNAFFNAVTLTNYGTVNWTNTAFYTGAGTLIYNYGSWNAQSDSTFAGNYNGNPGTVFDNIGVFRKSGSTGATILDSQVTLDNTGTVDVESGTLTLNGGGTSSGTGIFNSAGGATIDFDGGYNFYSVSSFSGAGGLVLNGGSFTVNGLITNANVQLESGTLTGTNVLEGTLTMSGGTLYGVMTVSNNGVLDIAAAGGNVFFNAVTLTNYGTVNWTNTAFYTGAGTLIYNYGLWDAQSDNYFYGNYNGNPGTIFDNVGILRKSGGTGTTTLDGTVTLDNPGTVDVESGVLSVTGLDSTGGTFTGGGVVQTVGATLNGLITSTNLQLVGGTLTGTNVLEGTLTLLSGDTLSGIMTVSSNGMLDIAAAGGNVFFNAVTLTNYGTVNWTNTAFYTGAGTLIYNYGLWDIQSDNYFYGNYNGNPGTIFDNVGILRKSGGTGTTTLDGTVTLDNTGTVDAESGVLSVTGLDSTGGTFTGSGVVQMASATLNGLITSTNLQLVSGTLTGTNVLAGTLTLLNGSTLSGVVTVSSNSVLDIAAAGGNVFFNAATLTNYGTVDWTSTGLFAGVGTLIYNYGLWNAQSDNSFAGNYNGNPATVFDNFGTFRKSGTAGTTSLDAYVLFTNTGTLDAQSGTVSLTTYDLTGGTLNFGINSLTDFGVINLAGGPALTGTISANLNSNYVALVGNAFPVVTFPSASGVFTNTNLPPVEIWQTAYDPSDVTITVLKLVPQLTWTNPANIVYGTLLGGTQLNATAASPTNLGGSLAGTFTYNPPALTQLSASNNQILSVLFTPADQVNYTNVSTSVVINVLKKPLTIASGISANNKVYDRTTTATLSSNNVVFSGVVTGDTITLNTNGYTANFASAGVGTGIAVGVTGLALSGANAVNYTFTQPSSLTANITKATVTVSSGITANSKVYDRTTTATLSSNAVVLAGVVAGDTLTLNTNGYTANFASAGAANGIAIIVSGLTLTGSSNADYTLTQPASLTANITKATVTVFTGLTANNKVYDRTTTATLNSNTVVLAGVVAGDTIILNTNGYTANFASAGVANGIAVVVGGLTLTGSSNSDYSLTQPAGLSANITKATVTISSGLTANNKVYDRTTTATLSSNTVVLAGVVVGDTITLNTNGYTANFASAGVANGIGVVVSGLTLTGSSNSDYTLTQPAGLSANITAVTVTISSGITANSKVYDRTTTATLSSNTVVLAGVVAGDTINLNTNGYTANFASAGVATGIAVTVSGLTLTGTSNSDYTLAQPAGLAANITKATVTISSGLTANNKVYDRTTTATLSSNTVVLAGVVAGDTITLNTNGYTANFASAGVATGIAVTVSGLALTGSSNSDYALTQPAGLSANITKATVTVSSGITANSKVYDRTTTATLSSNTVVLAGVVAGDTITLNTNGYTANFASAGVANGIGVIVSGLTLTGSSNSDYTLTQPAGLSANITAVTVTISSGMTANNKVYDRTTTATLSSNTVVLAGVVAGDTITLNTNGYTANFASAGVASGIAVNVSGLALTGSSNSDYTLTQPAGLTANITKATVTVSSGLTANNKVYDRTTTATFSSNTVVLAGVVAGDTITLNTNGYTANFASAGVANGIAVIVSGLTLTGSSNSDYALTQPASLSANITKATVTISSGITANNKMFDNTTSATLSSNNVVLAGVISGDTLTLNTNSYTATFTSAGVGNGIAVVVTGLTLSGATTSDYSLTQPAGLTASITVPTLTLVSSQQSITLAWPTNASAFVLNRTPNLALPITWTQVTSGISVNGTNNTISINDGSGNQYYALIAP